MAPSCTPALHGPSHLSRAPDTVPPRSDRESAKKRKHPPPSRPAKRPRKKLKRARLLRAWRRKIAGRLLRRQFHAPEPSRRRTMLRCLCAELADGRYCALHQVTAEGGEWAREMRRLVPLAAGPGEVRVPTLADGDSAATVMQYGRWRRSVWMPSRFYLEHAAAEQQSMAQALQDGSMMDETS
jgi:hypothetical protein